MFGHQTIILNKLKVYLTHCYKTQFKEDIPEEFQAIIQKLDDGHCFSFSVLHGVMDELGELAWWEYVLFCIETWDEDPASLYHTIEKAELTDKIPLRIKGEAKKTLLKTTLESLFERILNYIIYHQAAWLGEFLPEELDDLNLLQRNNHLLEVSSKNGEILTIKDRKIALVGPLNSQDIVAALSGTYLGIAVVHNDEHTIRIGRHNDQWFIYDPNYQRDEGSLNDYRYLKYFSHQQAAIAELINILGSDLAIERASIHSQIKFHHKLPSEYKKMIAYIKNKQISPTLFYMLTKYRPTLAKRLMTVFFAENADSDKEKLISLGKILNAQNSVNLWTGLHMLAQYAPDALRKLITLAVSEEDQLVIAYIFQALDKQDQDQWTGLQIMARYVPDVLEKLIKLMNSKAENEQMVHCFAQALIAKNKDGWTGLQMITCSSPESLTQLISYLNRDGVPFTHPMRVSFAAALSQTDDTGNTALSYITLNVFILRAIIKLAPYVLGSHMDLLIKDDEEIDWLEMDAGLQNDLTLKEQLIIDFLSLTHQALLQVDQADQGISVIGDELTDQSIQKIARALKKTQIDPGILKTLANTFACSRSQEITTRIKFNLSALLQETQKSQPVTKPVTKKPYGLFPATSTLWDVKKIKVDSLPQVSQTQGKQI